MLPFLLPLISLISSVAPSLSNALKTEGTVGDKALTLLKEFVGGDYKLSNDNLEARLLALDTEKFIQLKVLDKEFSTLIETHKHELRRFDFELTKSQMEINVVEASSDSKFKSWWRPAVGWVCVFGLGYELLILPILKSVLGLSVLMGAEAALIAKVVALLPIINTPLVMALLVPLLGLGVYRTVEKIAKVKSKDKTE